MTELGELEPGDPVLLRFESHYNKEATQTVVGFVSDDALTNNAISEVAIESEGGDMYAVEWEGGVDRAEGPSEWHPYGFGARVYLLDQINLTGDIPAEELPEGDEQSPDPFLDGGSDGA